MNSQEKSYVSPEILKEKTYKYLIENNHITCDFDTFCDAVSVYQTPHGVYIDLYEGMNETMQTTMLNRIFNVTAKDLDGYKNVIDWWVQQHESVRYVKEIDTYIIINELRIEYKD